jgi:hypothetical protein
MRKEVRMPTIADPIVAALAQLEPVAVPADATTHEPSVSS